MKIFIASDHAGFDLKNELIKHNKHQFHDLGTYSTESVDYPDYALIVANKLKNHSQSLAVLICGSGIGMSIAANRHPHVRAALCANINEAKLARSHNDANILVLGASTTQVNDAIDMLDTFVNTKFEAGRHQNRVRKLDNTITLDSQIDQAIAKELYRQQSTIELIASENFASPAVLKAQGSVLTNKYAEGYIGKRYYGGCEFIDEVEKLAIERVKKLYDVSFANVQPHSGSQANQAVFLALLNPGDTFLGMSLDAGGHLTHGCKVNMSGKWFNAVGYGVDRETGLIDMQSVMQLAREYKPKVIIAGGSAYPRTIDFAKFRSIADEIGAYFMVDMAHFSGLVAGKQLSSPIPHAHVVTSTTHKTLRGPRGGIILTNDEIIAKKIDSAIFPGLQGGPLMHVIAAKAIAFQEALDPKFQDYSKKVISNAQHLADTIKKRGYSIFTNGTDSHLILVDLRPQKLTGKDAEAELEKVGITCNKNSIPFDTQKPFITSGIRLGTPACTTRGFGTYEFEIIGNLIADVLDGLTNGSITPDTSQQIKNKVDELCQKFPLEY